MEDVQQMMSSFEAAARGAIQQAKEALARQGSGAAAGGAGGAGPPDLEDWAADPLGALANAAATFPSVVYEETMKFVHAVDWREPWIIGLLAAEALLLLLIAATRRRTNFQGILFLVVGAIIFGAPRINALCASRWETFARQPYFDPSGLFITTMLSGPLLVCEVVIVINHLVELCRMIIKVKRAQLRAEARRVSAGNGAQEPKKER